MSLWGNRDSYAITGTSISVINGSTAIVSNGATATTFTTDFKEGSVIVINSIPYKIYKITDDTHITLAVNYNGTTATVANANLKGQDMPKYLIQALAGAPEHDLTKIFFVSQEEALLTTNHNKGINGAGWWRVNTYTDSDGTVRFKNELLVAMTVLNATSGDATDDLTVADSEATISISVQPANQTTVTGGATFSVTAAVTGGNTVTYQWQKATVGSSKFANVVGQTASTIVLSGQTSGNTGDRYRVVLKSTAQGGAPVTSSSATLTFGS